MSKFRICHTVEIMIDYEAADIDGALNQARDFQNAQAVGDLIEKARDLFVLDPKDADA